MIFDFLIYRSKIVGVIFILIMFGCLFSFYENKTGYESTFLLKYHHIVFSNELRFKVPPENATILKKFNYIGQCTNNGSNNLVSSMLIKTTLNKGIIKQFYYEKTVNSVECRVPPKHSAIKIFFYENNKLEGYVKDKFPTCHPDIEKAFDFKAPKQSGPAESYFVIYSECDVGPTWWSAL
jgi:hypothetical protein